MAGTPVLHTIRIFAIVASWSAQIVNAQLNVEGQYMNMSSYNVATAAQNAAMQAEMDKAAKMAAVNKVISDLNFLKSKVTMEGVAESRTYDEFACFCKDTQAKKAIEITEGEDLQANAGAEVANLIVTRRGLDNDIEVLSGEIKGLEDDKKAATLTHKETVTTHAAEIQDLQAALIGLEGAISTLKASAPSGYAAGAGSLLQVQSMQKTINHALLLADALGLSVNSTGMQAFIQEAPEIQYENYKFQSDGIIGTMESMVRDFEKTKSDLETAEVSRIATYQSYLQTKDSLIAVKENQLEGKKRAKDKTQSNLEKKTQERSSAIAELNDDKEYQAKLFHQCANKKITYDQRKAARLGEISMITQVVEIIRTTVAEKTSANTYRLLQTNTSRAPGNVFLATAVAHDKVTMEDIEAAVEDEEAADASQGAPGFLQRRAVRQLSRQQSEVTYMSAVRETISELLNRKGVQFKSAMLMSLATRLSTSEDPFIKVKDMIQALIEKLQREAAEEAGQKGVCDQQLADATTRRESAVNEVRTLNSDMAQYEAAITKLTDEIATLVKQEAELNAAQAKANMLRGQEHMENQATEIGAQEGESMIRYAKDIIFKAYANMRQNEIQNMTELDYKSSNTSTYNVYVPPPVEVAVNATAFAQRKQSPEFDMPDAGFEMGESYLGEQGSASGIIGMMEVIESDFARTVKKVKKDERKQLAAYEKFTHETSVSLNEKEVLRTNKVGFKGDYQSDLEAAGNSLETQMSALAAAITELITHKETCIDTGMSYEERVARREEEIAALRQALCILEAKNGMNYDPTEEC